MIVWLVDQSRHRAAHDSAGHQRRAVEVAAMAFRCVIGTPATATRSVGSSRAVIDAPLPPMALGRSALAQAGVAQW